MRREQRTEPSGQGDGELCNVHHVEVHIFEMKLLYVSGLLERCMYSAMHDIPIYYSTSTYMKSKHKQIRECDKDMYIREE